MHVNYVVTLDAMYVILFTLISTTFSIWEVDEVCMQEAQLLNSFTVLIKEQ